MRKREILRGVVNRVAAVGIELEGGWDKNCGEEMHTDNSVKFPPPIDVAVIDPNTGLSAVNVTGVRPKYGIGEVISKPLPPAMMDEWVMRCYPQHVNGTCGLHVHMSFFYKLNYSRLMTPDFGIAIIEAVKEFGFDEGLAGDHPLWLRITDTNHPHCAQTYCGDKQVLVKGKDYRSRGTDHSRYTAINYCYSQHKTIECRLLPMFETAAQSIRAIRCIIDTTNKFLSKVRLREQKQVAVVLGKPDVFQEFGTVTR